MTQFLRPDSNVTQTNFTGGFAEIDETVASDADKAYPNATNVACTLEVGLSNPSPAGTPASGTTTVRYRLAKVNVTTGAVSGTLDDPTATLHIYQGAVLIASDTARTLTGGYTDFSFTPDMSAATDWNDLRARLSQTTTSTSRGAAISFLEMEAPLTTITGTLAATEGAIDTFAGAGMVYNLIEGALIATEAPDVLLFGEENPYLPIYGTPNVCPRCGERTRVREMKKEWTGQRVCGECWDPRPAETRPPFVRPEGLPLPGSNPEPPPVFGRIEP